MDASRQERHMTALAATLQYAGREVAPPVPPRHPASASLWRQRASQVNRPQEDDAMSNKIMQNKIRLNQVLNEIEQALLKIGEESCPMLDSDEFQLVVEEAARRVTYTRNLRDRFNQH